METTIKQALPADKKPVASSHSHRSAVMQKKLDEANAALAELNKDALQILGVKPEPNGR